MSKLKTGLAGAAVLFVGVGIGMAGSTDTTTTTEAAAPATTTTVVTTTTVAPTTTTEAPTTTTTIDITLEGEEGFFFFLDFFETTEAGQETALWYMDNDLRFSFGDTFCDLLDTVSVDQATTMQIVVGMTEIDVDEEQIAAVGAINVAATTFLCPEYEDDYNRWLNE